MQEGPKNKKDQPRQRKLTYVAGVDGRRYVNDKILRNLEASQRNQNGDYIAYATPDETRSYEAYDPFKPIDINELSGGAARQEQQSGWQQDYDQNAQQGFDQSAQQGPQEYSAEQYGAEQQQHTARNTWDESTNPALGEAVTINSAETINADLEAALQRAQARGSVHATYYDLAKGAFGAHAHAEPQQVEYQAHGYQDPAAAGVPPAGSTGDVHATHYDGYSDPSYQQVIEKVQQQPRRTNEGMPGPVPMSAQMKSKPSGTREEYNKLLGGLFKEESSDRPPPPAPPDESAASMYEPPMQQTPMQEAPQQVPQQHVPQPQSAEAVSPPQQIVEQSSTQQPTVEPSAVRSRPKPERIPVKIQRVKPPLPQQRADEIYFEDNANSGKTAVFKMPKEGVVSSSRGTVELLVHKGGRMFRPHYNPVGILLRVDVSDGFSLIKGDTDKAHWLMTDREGNPLDEEEIVSVAFDKKGNLWYETISGKKTKFLVSGSVEVTGDNKQ